MNNQKSESVTYEAQYCFDQRTERTSDNGEPQEWEKLWHFGSSDSERQKAQKPKPVFWELQWRRASECSGEKAKDLFEEVQSANGEPQEWEKLWRETNFGSSDSERQKAQKPKTVFWKW